MAFYGVLQAVFPMYEKQNLSRRGFMRQFVNLYSLSMPHCKIRLTDDIGRIRFPWMTPVDSGIEGSAAGLVGLSFVSDLPLDY